MAVLAGNSDNYESIEIVLSKEKTPRAYKEKLDELLETKAFNTKEEAEEWLKTAKFDMEIIYEKGNGLFLVESEAIESGGITSPYTQEDVIPMDED